MVSIKRIVTVTLVVVVILLVSALGINSYVTDGMIQKYDLISRNIKDMSRLHTELDLDFNVLDNIVGQKEYLESKDLERNERLLAAYKARYSETIYTMDKLSDIIVNIRSEGKDLSNIPNANYNEMLDSFLTKSDKIYYNMIEFEKIVFNTYSKDIYMSTDETDSLWSIYESIQESIVALDDIFVELNSYTIMLYGRIMNGLIVALIFIVVALSYMLLRLLLVDLYSVIGEFKKLDRHDYDSEHLIRKKHLFKEEQEIFKLVNDVFQEQKLVDEVKNIISRSYIIDDILKELFDKIDEVIGVDRLGIAFVDYNDRSIVADYGISKHSNVMLKPGFRVSFDETTLTKIIYTKRGSITPSIQRDLSQRPDSKSLKIIDSEGIKSNMILPLIKDDTVFAIMFLSSREEQYFKVRDLNLASKIVYDIGSVVDLSYLTKIVFSNVTNTFAELVDKKDNETGGHIIRMVAYSRIIAEGLVDHENLDYRRTVRFVSEIERNASVHDIGKVGIPDSILKKPGKLTADEWEIMKTHSQIGGEIFNNLKNSLKGFNQDFYKIAENIAKGHHEKWDGKGYPHGISGMDIPLEARVVAIADVFDALTSKRVYKDEFGFENSVEIIKESAGSHFDPVLVEIFINKLDEIKGIYLKNKDFS